MYISIKKKYLQRKKRSGIARGWWAKVSTHPGNALELFWGQRREYKEEGEKRVACLQHKKDATSHFQQCHKSVTPSLVTLLLRVAQNTKGGKHQLFQLHIETTVCPCFWKFESEQILLSNRAPLQAQCPTRPYKACFGSKFADSWASKWSVHN